MHDPMTVAFSVPSPIPRRDRFHDHPDLRSATSIARTEVYRDGSRRPARRWGWTLMRRTNDEDLGRLVYPWWRPHGLGPLRLAGRAFSFNEAVCVWHVEPKGSDSGTVCRHMYRSGARDEWPARWKIRLFPWYTLHPARPADPNDGIYPNGHDEYVTSWAWKWHVRHWKITIRFEQKLRRFLLERCEECGRRFPWGYSPVSHSWDGTKVRWRDGVTRSAFHHECSALTSVRDTNGRQADALRWLTERWRVDADLTHAELLHRLKRYGASRPPTPADPKEAFSGEYMHGRRWMVETIERALGWKYNTEREGYENEELGLFVTMAEAMRGPGAQEV